MLKRYIGRQIDFFAIKNRSTKRYLQCPGQTKTFFRWMNLHWKLRNFGLTCIIIENLPNMVRRRPSGKLINEDGCQWRGLYFADKIWFLQSGFSPMIFIEGDQVAIFTHKSCWLFHKILSENADLYGSYWVLSPVFSLIENLFFPWPHLWR